MDMIGGGIMTRRDDRQILTAGAHPDGTTGTALADRVYAELVRALYASALQAYYMAAIFALYLALVLYATADRPIMALGAVAVVAWAMRIALTLRSRHEALTASLDRAAARRLELRFAVPYSLFSALLGLIGGRVFWLPHAEARTLTICVLVGFCAGVATGVGTRPRLATLCMALAMAPTLVVGLCQAHPLSIGLALIAAAYVSGGRQSLKMRHDMVMAEIGHRLVSLTLARRDNLTALPNRLALREHFEANAQVMSAHGLIAVHYLDLDGFKPVNDAYGHGTGDRLLEQVAHRLRGAIRNGDIVARLGGDEFAVVQFGLGRAEEAGLLAERLRTTIAQPFELDGHTILISTCVGTVVSDNRADPLDSLLQAADARLYQAKRMRGASTRRVA